MCDVRILRLPVNEAGRDFIIGDLHGQIHLLNRLMAEVEFNQNADRMLSVGDLVDRGEQSLECLGLLRKPWFFAAMGNHEDMLLDYMRMTYQNVPSRFYGAKGNNHPFMHNGGSWALWALSSDDESVELSDLAFNNVVNMPHLIVVGGGDSRFHVVHAEMDAGWNGKLMTNDLIDAADFPADEFIDGFDDVSDYTGRLMWGRTIIKKTKSKLDQLGGDKFPSWREGLSPTFCGHTILPHRLKRMIVHSHVHLDSGAYQSSRDPGEMGLTMVMPDRSNPRRWTTWTAGDGGRAGEFVIKTSSACNRSLSPARNSD